jgi:DNA polymerase-3 subunit delta
VDLHAAAECVGDSGSSWLEDALFAATGGDLAHADRFLARAVAGGSDPVQILRGALLHLHRLYQARMFLDAGRTAPDAIRALRQPVFFKRQAALARAVAVWPVRHIAAATTRVQAAERSCKTTGAPAAELATAAVMAIALRAAKLVHGQSGRGVSPRGA